MKSKTPITKKSIAKKATKKTTTPKATVVSGETALAIVKANDATKKAKSAKPAVATKTTGPRAASKQAELIGLLRRPTGAGLAEIMKKFGWQQHTTRAIMSQGGSLKKKHGIDVISERNEAGERTYRIAR